MQTDSTTWLAHCNGDDLGGFGFSTSIPEHEALDDPFAISPPELTGSPELSISPAKFSAEVSADGELVRPSAELCSPKSSPKSSLKSSPKSSPKTASPRPPQARAFSVTFNRRTYASPSNMHNNKPPSTPHVKTKAMKEENTHRRRNPRGRCGTICVKSLEEALPYLPPMPPPSDHARTAPRDAELVQMARDLCHELPRVKLNIRRFVQIPKYCQRAYDTMKNVWRHRLQDLTNTDKFALEEGIRSLMTLHHVDITVGDAANPAKTLQQQSDVLDIVCPIIYNFGDDETRLQASKFWCYMFGAREWMAKWLKEKYADCEGCDDHDNCITRAEQNETRDALVRLGVAYAKGRGGRTLTDVHDMWAWINSLGDALELVRYRPKCECLEIAARAADGVLMSRTHAQVQEKKRAQLQKEMERQNKREGYSSDSSDSSDDSDGGEEPLLQRLEASECVDSRVAYAYAVQFTAK